MNNKADSVRRGKKSIGFIFTVRGAFLREFIEFLRDYAHTCFHIPMHETQGVKNKAPTKDVNVYLEE
jgi:hypothetical protein